jgi:GTPase
MPLTFVRVVCGRSEVALTSTSRSALSNVDTGGVGPSLEEHPLGKEIERAAAQAVQEADLIVFVVDGTRDVGTEEFEVASWLRRQSQIDNKSIWVLANKNDSRKFDDSSYHALGFERVLSVSAEHDVGFQDFWESVDVAFGGASAALPETETAEDKNTPRIVVLGRPNVGKSTLLNAILGDERHVVSEMPGTTRDVIESTYRRHDMLWKLCDTAGMRRPGRLEQDVEQVARYKLEDAARDADVAIILIDSSEGVTDLDAAIAGMAVDFGLSVVVAFNKWDRMKGEQAHDMEAKLDRTRDLKMDFLEWCPTVKLSGLTGKGVSELLKAVERVLKARQERVQTSKLNQLFERKLRHHAHPMGPRGRPAKFYYLSQVESNPPAFVLFSNIPGNAVHFSYKRYITNSLREAFGFEGTPIRLHFKTARGAPA